MKIELGNKIPGEKFHQYNRDALHVAVLPCIAGDQLEAGEPVTILNNHAYSDEHGEAIGIVDPFLKNPLFRGDHFFVLMNPGEVQNLRHEWNHPNVPSKSYESIYEELSNLKEELREAKIELEEMEYEDECRGCW